MASWLKALTLRRILSTLIVAMLIIAPVQVFAGDSLSVPAQSAMASDDCDPKPCPCDEQKANIDCAKMASCLVKCSAGSWVPQLPAILSEATLASIDLGFEPHALLSAIAEPLRRPPRA